LIFAYNQILVHILRLQARQSNVVQLDIHVAHAVEVLAILAVSDGHLEWVDGGERTTKKKERRKPQHKKTKTNQSPRIAMCSIYHESIKS
jgi:hypothetical protein